MLNPSGVESAKQSPRGSSAGRRLSPLQDREENIPGRDVLSQQQLPAAEGEAPAELVPTGVSLGNGLAARGYHSTHNLEAKHSCR